MQISIVAIVDIILIVSLLFALIKGWHIGLAMRLAHFVALVVSCVVANLCAASLKVYVSNSWIVPLMQKKAGNSVCSIPYAQNGMELAAQGIAIVFTIAMVILGRLIGLLHIVDHIPVIGKINKVGGAIVGFLITFIILYVVGNALFTLLPQTMLDGWGFTKEAIAKTYLLQIFADF